MNIKCLKTCELGQNQKYLKVNIGECDCQEFIESQLNEE